MCLAGKFPFSRLFWTFEKPEKTRVFLGADFEKPETRVLKIRPESETLVILFCKKITLDFFSC